MWNGSISRRRVIPPEVISQIRGEDARRFKVIPIGIKHSALIVAVADPFDIDTIDSLSFLLQREIGFVCASPEKIQEALIANTMARTAGGSTVPKEKDTRISVWKSWRR